MEREYSVNFGQYNTWSDWHLTPAERPIVEPPTEKKHDIDLPGGSGVIDAAQALTGYPVFNMREGSWDFYVENDNIPFVRVYHAVMAVLQGKTLQVSLEEDPAYFYEGRCWVENPKQTNGHTMLTVKYSLKPFKHRFDEVGAVKKYTVNGTLTINIDVSKFTDEPVCPKLSFAISAGGKMTVEYLTAAKRYSAAFGNGTWTDPEIMLIPGQYVTLTVTGTGTFTMQAPGGWF